MSYSTFDQQCANNEFQKLRKLKFKKKNHFNDKHGRRGLKSSLELGLNYSTVHKYLILTRQEGCKNFNTFTSNLDRTKSILNRTSRCLQ